ncbi:coiled-coil domain-containing protein [Riemerella anatipestifer]|uniref:coiled-coil domain-containing protein n=1 Tax=Riemerella anatipestifer TaxID=34085 RepID=UPI001BDA368B|nr:hypothetical protein [Riemerella anatipestifer]MBT0554299.1 hypothetical protein [Riemerella anatipestifer]MCE3024964.1 hypothetical protein [Riemerella anatipestifer]MDY3345964.1 hypothetical protein [Riemerella anatipestifer]MDY3348327.1 hypothetical protein [Riemerella anatipestifer]MDY3449849.1 hypothetical protein [Riemerella anatipestifer]
MSLGDSFNHNDFNRLKEFDFDAYIAKNYKDTELSEVCFGSIDAIQFKKILNRIISWFGRVIKSDMFYLLPEYYISENETYGITNELDMLVHWLNVDDRYNAYQTIKNIIVYILLFGGWNKEEVVISHQQISDLQSKQSLIQAQLETNLSALEELKSKITNQTEASEELNKKADSLYNNLLKNKEDIQNDKAEIDTMLALAKQNSKDIEAVKASINAHEAKIVENIYKYEKNFSVIKSQNEDSLSNMEEAIRLQKEILDKRQEVENLLGAAADGSLGVKFEKRREIIGSSSSAFLYTSGFIFLLALGWTFYIYKEFSVNPKDSGLPVWAGILLNFIKITPAWWLFIWVTGRYSRERKLEEIYAFKSATAMTVRNHANLLKDDDGGDANQRASRQIMLLKSVENIYKEPSVDDKKEKELSMKKITNLVKQLTETIKEIKN